MPQEPQDNEAQAELNPYAIRCPKCGSTKYLLALAPPNFSIVRHCEQCGHDWTLLQSDAGIHPSRF